MDPVIEEIRRRADIVEVVGDYVSLVPAGAERWKACCPFHNEKTPSFNVSRDKGFFKCFGCGQAGDVFKFVSLIENLPFGEVKRKLAERYGVPLRDHSEKTPEQAAALDERARLVRITATATAWFGEQLAGNAGLPARDYARARKLSRETLEAFGIGYAPDSWDACTSFLTKKFGYAASEGAAAGLLVEKEDERGKRYYDRYRHRLIFPIWDESGKNIIAFGGRALEGGETGTPEAKYINSPEGKLFSKSRVLYAWHKAKDEVRRRESLIVTEGYMDAIALHAAGFANTVATLGTSLTQEHVSRISRIGAKTLLLCFDSDGAGMKAALRSGPMFDAIDIAVRVITLPERHDPDTFISEFGKAKFDEVLTTAPTLTRYRIDKIAGKEQEWRSKSRVEQQDAIKEIAQVLSEIKDDIGANDYIAEVANSLSLFLSGWDPVRLEQSIRTQVKTAQKLRIQEERNQRRREQERAAVQERLREKGSGEVIALPQREPQRGDDDSHKYLQPDDGPSSESSVEVIPFTPRARSKREWVPDAEWRSRGDWKKREAPTHNSIEANLPAEEAGGTDIIAARTLANVAMGDDSGVVRAERALLGAMLSAPSLRHSLSERLGAAMWTREAHFEIASYLKALPEEEPLDPPRLLEELSPEASDLATSLLLLKTMESTERHVLDDYIKIINAHHSRQSEHQGLQLLIQKLLAAAPGSPLTESVAPEDKARFEESARATKRKLPPE